MKLFTGVLLGAIGTLAALSSAGCSAAAPQLENAPDFSAEFSGIAGKGLDADGPHSLGELRGRVVLIEFWRTW